MKKIKNPERYIQRLKNRIEYLEHLYERQRQEASELRGKSLWRFADETDITRNFDWLPDLRPGQRVVIRGMAIKRQESFNPACQNEKSEITIRLVSCSVIPDKE